MPTFPSRTLLVLLTALVGTVLVGGGQPLAGEVDKLAISHDFLSLPRTEIYIAPVPQPTMSKGKLKTSPTLGLIMTQELGAALQAEIPSAKVRILESNQRPPGGLLVSCRFSRLIAGSRAKRFWLGFGAGKSVLELSGEISDVDSGRVVARFVHARLSWCCGFGSNDHEIRTNLVNAAQDIALIAAGQFDSDQEQEWLPQQLEGASVIQPAPPVDTAEAASGAGALVIQTSEANAEVEIDGKFVGMTPVELQLPAGLYLVVVKKAGFAPWKREIRMLPGSKQQVRVDLERGEVSAADEL